MLKAGDSPPWVRGQREGWETSRPPGGYEPGWKSRWSGWVSERAPVWGAAWGSGQSPRHSEPQVGTGGARTQVLGDNRVECEGSSSGLLRTGRPGAPLPSPCAALPPWTQKFLSSDFTQIRNIFVGPWAPCLMEESASHFPPPITLSPPAPSREHICPVGLEPTVTSLGYSYKLFKSPLSTRLCSQLSRRSS